MIYAIFDILSLMVYIQHRKLFLNFGISFQSSFFSEETIDLLLQWQQIRQAEQHKILYPKSQVARKHMETTMKRKAQFLSAHPLFHLP